MAFTIRVCRRYHTEEKKNPISGHRWPEDSFLNLWDVHSDIGIHSTHRSEDKANEVAEELQEFYDKYLS